MYVVMKIGAVYLLTSKQNFLHHDFMVFLISFFLILIFFLIYMHVFCKLDCLFIFWVFISSYLRKPLDMLEENFNVFCIDESNSLFSSLMITMLHFLNMFAGFIFI